MPNSAADILKAYALPPWAKFRVHLDYETASACDLRKTGAERYAMDGSTRILCVAWSRIEVATGKIVSGGTAINRPRDNSELTKFEMKFVQWARDRDTVFCAWNAAFEETITTHCLGFQIEPKFWRCTMARAAFWGLPMKLGDAGEALGLGGTAQKSKAGHALMMKLCRPDKKTGGWEHHTDAALNDLAAYCAQDVVAEMAIHARTPELPPVEQDTWELDRTMNLRGVGVDLDLVRKLRAISDQATVELDRRMHALTKGAVPSARNAAKLLAWVNARLPNVFMVPDLKRRTVRETLAELASLGDTANADTLAAREALEIRADAARSSAAKLTVMDAAASENIFTRDGKRVRGLLQYYGAGRTGRWAGRLVQPQNMPRPSFKTVTQAISAVRQGASWQDLEMIFPESALGVVAGCLRGCLTGNLLSGDSSQIEARMVAWLAGQQDILDVFARKEDVYVYTAAKLGSKDRQFGKVLVLACGFGMGASKFQDTAASYGVMLSALQAEDAVRGWRDASPYIVRFWYACDDAARRIATGAANMVQVRSIKFERVGKTMFVWLPSGRPLVYREIGVEADPVTGRDSITYMGVDQKTRKWAKLRTYGGKLVENITQAAARDVLRDALLAAEAKNLRPVLTVHDEILCDTPASFPADPKGALKALLDCLQQPVAWAPGLPLGAEGWHGERYRK